jgi:hypothetical protein
MPPHELKVRLEENEAAGLRLVDISGYPDEREGVLYTAVWEVQ